MSNERRYSVWKYVKSAEIYGPEHEDWHCAKDERDSRSSDWNVFDHSTTPPTNVTDADTEAVTEKRWSCRWDGVNGYVIQGTGANVEYWSAFVIDGEVEHAALTIHSAAEPTYAEFRAAVKAATGVSPPEPEEPQWHYWNPYGWQRSEPKPRRDYVHFDGFDNSGQVWGTTADRDRKRDALLEAAKAAGKDGEG